MKKILLIPLMILLSLLTVYSAAADYNIVANSGGTNDLTLDASGNEIYCQGFTTEEYGNYLHNVTFNVGTENCDGSQQFNWLITQSDGGDLDYDNVITNQSFTCDYTTGDNNQILAEDYVALNDSTQYILCGQIFSDSLVFKGDSGGSYAGGHVSRSSDGGQTHSTLSGYDLRWTLYFKNGTYSPTGNFSVTVTDAWDGSALNGINVTINGSTYENATGNIVTTHILQNATITYDINISSPDYFSGNLSSVNVSSSLSTTLNQSYVSFRGFEFISGIELSPINFTISGTTKGANQTFNLKNGSYTVVASKEGYENKSLNINVSSLDNNSYNITGIAANSINITAINIFNGSPIKVFNVSINSSYYGNYTTTNGTINVPGSSLNLSVTYSASGFNDLTVYHVMNTNLTTTLFTYNTLNISFYDEDTGVLIDDRNITIDAISDDYADNYSTTSGTINISFLVPEEYNLRYNADGYSQGTYFFTLVDDSYNYLNLTMVNASTVANVTITVVDQYTDPVEQARVKVLKYDVTSNSYETVSIRQTNFEGETTIPITLYTEFYKFIIEYEGETLISTNPSYITKTSLTIQVVIDITIGEEIDYYNSITHGLSYNNVTDNVKLTYNDARGIGTYICLYVKSWDTGLLNSSCSTSSAATILIPLTPDNNTIYSAEAYYRNSYSEMVLLSKITIYGDSSAGVIPLTNSKAGLFLQLLLSLTVVLVTIWSPTIMYIALPFSILLGRALGLISIDYTYIVPLVVLGFILTLIMSRKA